MPSLTSLSSRRSGELSKADAIGGNLTLSTGSSICASAGRHLWKTCAFVAGMHPRLGAAAVNLHPRLVGGRVIECASEDDCNTRQHIGFGDDTRSAIRAKPPAHLLSRVAGIILGLQFALQVDRC